MGITFGQWFSRVFVLKIEKHNWLVSQFAFACFGPSLLSYPRALDLG